MEFSNNKINEIELRKIYSTVQQVLERNFSDEELTELVAQKDTKSVTNVRETLDAFKEHIGDDHYNALAGGAAFATMLDQWLSDRAQKRIDDIWERLSEKIPEKELSKISRHDLKQFLLILTSR